MVNSWSECELGLQGREENEECGTLKCIESKGFADIYIESKGVAPYTLNPRSMHAKTLNSIHMQVAC
jgi:hypothetical protein